MSIFHLLRRRRRHTGYLLGVFAIAWLQMALSPCLMAGELADPRLAAGAPSAHIGDVDPTVLPDGHETHEVHCDYCPPADEHRTCAEASGDCAFLHDPSVDARNLTSQIEKLSQHAALLDGSAFGLLHLLREPEVPDRPAAPAAAPRRSINLENCVQLR
ncbi:MAG TPA: hypothetical protein VLT59_18110 [Steroidobacteraceae bacterium]|nr:hypothetical protein [Steroidobacteraceae bacterium]